MSVKKIFTTLIIVVMMVIVGAFAINVLLPNVTTTLIDSVEDMIYKATSLQFDFNANGNAGDSGGTYTGDNTDDTVTGTVGDNVEGFN